MRTARPEGTPVAVGDTVTDTLGVSYTLKGVAAAPTDSGYAGGAFAGRALVEDSNGTVSEPYAFEVGLIIEVT
jgi:expansin (peptidoglycan-binding protein)